MKNIYVAIDFDGTVVLHEYPKLGREAPGACNWMRIWQEEGAKLILFTMRSDELSLKEAVDFCGKNGIVFYGVNENPSQKTWTQSPKVYAHIYVDDAGIGCPLKENPNGRPYVDWDIVGPAVLKRILEIKNG
jgi:hypothetical protein